MDRIRLPRISLSETGTSISRGPLACLFLVVACLLGALFAPSAPAYELPPFCDGGYVHNYLSPIEKMPALHSPPTSGPLPFSPGSIHLQSLNSGQLQAGEGTIGYALSNLASGRAAQPHWKVTASLSKIDRQGRPRKILKTKQLRLSHLGAGAIRYLSFHVSREPTLYRVDVLFRSWSGKPLAAYGEYVRVVRSRLDVRLISSGKSFLPGQTVFARVANYGSESLEYGVDFSIEVFDGAGWIEAPISPVNVWPALAVLTGPGEAGPCSTFEIPANAAPGRYRFVKSVGYSRSTARSRQSHSLALHAVFDVLP